MERWDKVVALINQSMKLAVLKKISYSASPTWMRQWFHQKSWIVIVKGFLGTFWKGYFQTFCMSEDV